MKTIEVSIVIVTYNCQKVIEECLFSIPELPEIEVLVVDNCSIDNTREILNKFNGRIKLVLNEKNLGYTKGCNQGIVMAHGKYVFLLNPDTRLADDTVYWLVETIKMNPDAAAVAPILLNFDGSIQNYTRRFPSVSGLWVETFVPRKFWHLFSSFRKYTYQGINFHEEQKVEQPAGAAILFYNNITMDESYFIYGSDLDLCKEIYKKGKVIIQTPKSRVYHRGSEGGTATENYKIRTFLDLDNYYGMQYYFKKNKKITTLYLYRITFLAGLLFLTFASVFKKPSQTLIRAYKVFGFLNKHNFRNYVENN